MQRYTDDQILVSPTDLVTFLSCHHATFLDNRALYEKLTKTEESSTNQLLQKRGMEHEAAYLGRLKKEGRSIVEIPRALSLTERAELTLEAMKSGVDVVYQGVFFTPPWRGDADFLLRCETPSALGEFSYEVLDTKLARHAEVKHILQICMYSELLAEIQNLQPLFMHLVLGTGEKESFMTSGYFSYYTNAKQRFEHYLRNLPSASSPEPCPYCGFCHWKERCEREWEETDHLSLIANIQRTQENTLRKAGIHTISELASCKQEKISGMMQDTFLRLRSQAALQHHERSTGEKVYSLLEQEPGKGFFRIPTPDEGDLFFDMEGDPLYPDGLEYLFGIHTYINREHRFIPFWAHDHEQEEHTFDVFMNFLKDHLEHYPQAFIYHYNHYETTALKRLACRYARHEEMLDNLLRHQLFVDLYIVVREGLRTSQPGYSIKNMEAFYMDKRKNAVATATDSIVVYNTWRETGDDSLLQEIAAYNEVDCVSTRLLRDWLVSIRPEHTAWYTPEQEDDELSTGERREWEIEYERYRGLLEEGSARPSAVNTRITHLLEFHNREAKPQWWKMFARQTKTEDELIEDTECLAGLSLAISPTTLKRSRLWTYHFPPQDYKLKRDDKPTLIDTMESAGTIYEIDNTASTVTIKLGMKNDLPRHLSLGPPKPISAHIIRTAIYEYASRVIKNDTTPQVACEILSRAIPRITGKEPGENIVTNGELISAAQEAVAHLDSSYLFIQGPPGAGKTYISSHLIVDLLRRGKTIGVSSNSHKAVHNLLEKVEKVAQESGFAFRGVKKATRDKEETEFNGMFITSVLSVQEM
ncbi:MAG: TM0106 family RecB-like putative nuclease, partial [Sphaerochaetaceae bacterium]|nr:TM0106 family RecB-like putative nuclease [Sphaerochaetaceae bacterium]